MYPLVTLHNRSCSTASCPRCGDDRITRHGHFFRRDDSRRIPRFRCKGCSRTFSRAGYSLFYRHRHRRLNERIRLSLVNSGTLRGTARMLRIDKETVARHMILQAKIARHRHSKRRMIWQHATCVQFDDLHTIEHTKLKPVAVSLITDADRWNMIGIQVSRIPASGPHAWKSRERYGLRPDDSIAARERMMMDAIPYISPTALFVTDKHLDYPPLITKHFPNARHSTHHGARGSVTGHGELKNIGYDPLFCVNHQFATFRACLSRLVRRTWTTTKRLDRLEDHLMLLVDHYNHCRKPMKRTHA